MTRRPKLSPETYERLVEIGSDELDEPEHVTRDRPTEVLILEVMNSRQEYREAAVAWQQKAKRLESADGGGP